MGQGQAFSLILWSTDIPALARFLVEVADMQLEEQHPGFASLSAAGFSVMIHDDESYRGHPWHEALQKEGVARGIGAELHVGVRDVERAYSHALKLGGISLYPPYQDGGQMECQVMGPDGYMLSMWSPVGRRA